MFRIRTNGKFPTLDIVLFTKQLQDIRDIKSSCYEPRTEVSAVSIHAFPNIEHYSLMNCGASMGRHGR